jgi:hypothetical protein
MKSSFRFLYQLSLLPVFLLLSFSSFAGDKESGGGLASKVGKAKAEGIGFLPVDLFAAATAARHTSILRDETLLQPLQQAVSAVYKNKPQAIALTLKADNGKVFTLELLTAHPVAATPNMGVFDASGRHQVAYENGAHYQGVVAGEAHSMASMSVFANGDVMILFSTPEGNFTIGKVEDNSGNYVFYNDRDLLETISNACGVTDSDYPADKEKSIAAKGTQALLCEKVQVYWEADYELFVRKGSTLAGAQNFMTGLFNQMQALYANENIAVELKSLYVWTVSDDYPGASSTVGLSKFKTFWNNLNNSFDGNIAHLITMDNNRNGGLAYVDVLCNRNNGYAYSEITGTFNSIPTYSWDVMVVTHETDHNFGSRHTHWCGWNTGAGGSCGSIDNCTTQETGSGCTTCPRLNSVGTSGWQGTIMSYCHLVSVGINLANGFGPIPGDYIRGNMTGSGCLESIISATLTPTHICDNDGAVNLSLNPDNFGVSPFSYGWSTNVFTQNISGLTIPSTYSVQVTDSNRCTAIFEVEVGRQPKAGNGLAITEPMPICCQSTTKSITLKATASSSINYTCQTINWLRTTIPITNVTDFKNAFDTAQAANIFLSTNAAAITEINGATLEIQPPVSCAVPTTYYYTPFVSRKPITALTVTGNTAAATAYAVNAVVVGALAVMPDQSALVTGCYLSDTPTTQTLAVTVFGYTGRLNKLTLVILNSANEILYKQFGLPGNGVYNIPMSVFGGVPLQSVRIRAYDFNCTTVNNRVDCITSAANVRAERIIYYDSITKPAYKSVGTCAVGTSIRVDFAPNACTSLAAPDMIAAAGQAVLYPNPASHTVTLKITAPAAGNSLMKVTDVVGRQVAVKAIKYGSGTHAEEINVASWARGVYFVTLSGNGVQTSNLKLVVE